MRGGKGTRERSSKHPGRATKIPAKQSLRASMHMPGARQGQKAAAGAEGQHTPSFICDVSHSTTAALSSHRYACLLPRDSKNHRRIMNVDWANGVSGLAS